MRCRCSRWARSRSSAFLGSVAAPRSPAGAAPRRRLPIRRSREQQLGGRTARHPPPGADARAGTSSAYGGRSRTRSGSRPGPGTSDVLAPPPWTPGAAGASDSGGFSRPIGRGLCAHQLPRVALEGSSGAGNMANSGPALVSHWCITCYAKSDGFRRESEQGILPLSRERMQAEGCASIFPHLLILTRERANLRWPTPP